MNFTIKMAEVTLIDLGYCKVESFSFSMTAPSLESLFENWGPTSVKSKRASLLRCEKSISVSSAILISKVQVCPTSSGLIDTHTHMLNAVTLVWGFLRLAPFSLECPNNELY